MVVCLAFAISLTTAADLRAQFISRDSATVEQTRILAELGRRYYFVDRRSLSGVDDCQTRIATICIADHVLEFGTQPVHLQYGVPIPSPTIPALPGEYDRELPGRLENLARVAPDNGWAIGQLAYLHSYNVGLDRALEIVRQCRGGEAWCKAIHGLVLHSYSRFAEADTLFAQALVAMPAAERCRWRDISMLLDAVSRARYQRMSCAERESFENNVWWLADPLFMLPGNDRRTEHYSRRVIDSLLTGAPSPFSTRTRPSTWDSETSEILMRYGLASHWFVPGRLVTPGDSRDRWVHLHTPSYHFVPHRLAAPADPAARATDFQLATPLETAIERYHPAYDYVTDLGHSQAVALPRGDSMLVAVATTPLREEYRAAGPFAVALYIAPDEKTAPVMLTKYGVADRANFTITVPRRDVLLGLEAMSDRLQVAGRTRYTLRAPSMTPPEDRSANNRAVVITQPLFYSPASALPRRAMDAIPLMLPSEKIIMGTPLGIYWEAGGVRAGTKAQMTARLVRDPETRSGFFGRIFGGGRGSPVQVITWTEEGSGDGSDAGHSVSLNITSLRAGKYTLELEIKNAEGAIATSRREFELVERDPPERDLISVLQQPVPKELYMTPKPARVRGRTR